MSSNQKVKTFLALFLVFCVFSSKGIIIYNEETLVALSFCAFVLFCLYYFGNTVQDSLNERGLVIKTELQNFLLLKEESLHELSQEHKRIANLQNTLSSLGSFTYSELAKCSSSGGRTLNNIFAQQVQQKVGYLESSKNVLQEQLQNLIATNIKGAVLLKIGRAQTVGGERGINAKVIKRSIDLLK
jgi:F0F1-type ATP synthase membrane subunit b/b'